VALSQGLKIKKILFIHTAFPGDIILAIPLLTAIDKFLHPDKLVVLSTPEGKSILKNIPFISDFIIYDKKRSDSGPAGFLKTLKRIKNFSPDSFDLAIIPHRFFRSALLAFMARIKNRIGFIESRYLLTPHLYTEKISRDTHLHEIERDLMLLLPFAGRDELFCYAKENSGVIPWSEEDEKCVSSLLCNRGFKNYIVVAPCSKWYTKAWPEEYFIKLIKMLISEGHRIVLTASPDRKDLAKCSFIEENISDKNLLNAAGKTSFCELSFLISKASLMITNDSAPMHVGASLDIPLIAIFGSTVKEFGFYPFSRSSHVIEKNLKCRPCGLHGKASCPKKHFKCMLKITPDELYQLAGNLLKNYD